MCVDLTGGRPVTGGTSEGAPAAIVGCTISEDTMLHYLECPRMREAVGRATVVGGRRGCSREWTGLRAASSLELRLGVSFWLR